MTKFPRIPAALTVAVALAVLVSVAAGTSAASSRVEGRHAVAGRLLDAQGRVLAAHPRVPGDPRRTGRQVHQSYGASTDQARAIVQGLPGDVANLSLAPDIDTLVQAHLVSKNWNHTRPTAS